MEQHYSAIKPESWLVSAGRAAESRAPLNVPLIPASNPLLTVADLDAICATPRKPGAIVAVDNTFATPLNQQPLHFGATLSMQSATKFIGGHSDLLAGLVTTKDDALWHGLRKSREL